jgi:hypothetical protein
MEVQSHKIVLLFLFTTMLAACGGGGGGSGGWVTIQSDNSPAIDKRMHGEAFKSPFHTTECFYIGNTCVFENQVWHPGVRVTWENLTTGEKGDAWRQQGQTADEPYVDEPYKWNAVVKLTLGTNQVRITATDISGNYGTAETTLLGAPPVPSDVSIESADGSIILDWSESPDLAYKVYWSTSSVGTYWNGAIINVTKPPFVHKNLTNGTKYYYVITSIYGATESSPSDTFGEIAGIPPKPNNVIANLTGSDVTLSWDSVPRADTYTVYWSNNRGVTKNNGNPIFMASSPYLHVGLTALSYYYIVIASNAYGESSASEEVTALFPIAPPTPSGLSATLRPDPSGPGYLPWIDLVWQGTPGVDYEIQRYLDNIPTGFSSLQGCVSYLETNFRYYNATSSYVVTSDNTYAYKVIFPHYSWDITTTYAYTITARNSFGASPPSDPVYMCALPTGQ